MKSKWTRGVVGFLVSGLVFGGVGYGVLYKQFLYPSQQKIDWETTRYNGLERSLKQFKSLGYQKQKNLLEFNKDRKGGKELIQKMAGVVEFSVDKVDALNKYGQVLKYPDGSGLKINPVLQDGQKVRLKVPDYKKIKPTKEEINKLKKFNSSEEMYGVLLEDVFIKYMNNLKTIPTKTIEFIPEYQQKGNGYELNDKSIEELNNLVYETKDFQDLMERFAEASIEGDPNPDVGYWKSQLKSAKEAKPKDTITKNTERSEWLLWNSKKDKDKGKEPSKYLTYFYMNPKFFINTSGSTGNGSFDFKSSIGVPVRTYFEGEKGVKIPVEVTVENTYVDKDAVSFLENKDTRNRGLQADSKLIFYVVEYKLKNLSTNTPIVPKLKEGFALSDEQGNLSARTGRMFGLNEMSNEGFVLDAGKEKDLVYWIAIPEFEEKELAWGTSFKNKKDIIWFNKLKEGYKRDIKKPKKTKEQPVDKPVDNVDNPITPDTKLNKENNNEDSGN